MFMRYKVTVNTSHYPKDVPWEVPEGWCWCKLEELCVFLSRGKSPVYSETSKEYPVFAQKCNLKEGGISLEKALFLNPDTLPKWPTEYRLKTGDVLVNSTGTGTVGRTRLFNEQVLGPYPFVVPDSHVSVIRTFSQISSEYVFILLSSEYGKQYFAENLAGSTNQKELYITTISEFQVPLPPAIEQMRIAERVFSFEDNIKNLDDEKIRIQAFVESAKAKILDLAIHGKLVPQDPSDEPAIELLKRINPTFTPSDNLHYEGIVPAGWQLCQLSDLFKITMGQSPDGSSLNHKSGIEFHQGKICFTEKYLTESGIFTSCPTKCAEPNSLLCCVRAPVGVFNITTRRICIGRGLCSLSPLDLDVDIEYWFYALCSLTEYYEGKATGSTFKAISGDIIRNTVIAVPPKMEQKRIREQITRLFSVLKEVADTI